MSERAWAGIAFGMSLGIIIGLRLNTAGMLFVATFLMAALLLCPLVAWRLATGDLWEEESLWVRIERMPQAKPPTPTIVRPALPSAPPRPARRGPVAYYHRPPRDRFPRRVAVIDAARR